MIKDIIERIKIWPELTKGHLDFFISDKIVGRTVFTAIKKVYLGQTSFKNTLGLYSGFALGWFTDMFMPSICSDIIHNIHNKMFYK